MKVLTDDQRARLLKTLATAPDEVLCSAVNEMKRLIIQIQNDYKDVNGFIGKEETKLVDEPAKPAVPMQQQAAPGASLEQLAPKPKAETPPGKACTRVGTDTKTSILAKCMVLSTAADVNKFLKRGASKMDDTVSILKLLWERGELTYSGGAYQRAKS